MRQNNSSVAAYIIKAETPSHIFDEARDWIASEHFPEETCSASISEIIPLDLPKDLTDHLRVGQASNPGSVVMVVRPVKL